MRQIDPLWWVAANLLRGAGFAVGIYMYVQSAVQERQREALVEVASAFVADVSAGRFAPVHARMAAPYRILDNPRR